MSRIRRSTALDGGSAVAEFVMTVAVLTAVFLAVLQLALVLHVRNTLMDAASAGARYGALADRTVEEGAMRTADIVSTSLSPRFAEDVSATAISVNGLEGVRVEISTHMPLLGFLPSMGQLNVSGEAVGYD
ncbi:TadE/TadG family type IV pilus assembly protein [Zhihengliuella flava]|uniref:TadE/TadG family type IV pilus assembly protein n=1 Tax=Zhihengliuella flava TaxID=1285193 RepID=UPI002F2B58BE